MLKRRIKKWLYGKCPGFVGSFSYYGTKVFFPEGSLVFDIAVDQGVYEHENLKALLSLIKAGSTYFDVGANIGLLSVPILYHESNCKVVSFEPSPNTAPFLQKTIDGSDYRNRWRLVSKAVGSRAGETSFVIAVPGLGAYDGCRDTRRVRMVQDVTVPLTTLDQEWEDLGRPRVSVVKIDVEGYEFEVLAGATTLIENERPWFLIELNQTNLDANGFSPEDIFPIIRVKEYAIYSLPGYNRLVDKTDLMVSIQYTETFLLAPIAC